MAVLENLQSITKRSKKRLGRGLGSGAGSKSGRGTKRHQSARENIPLHFEGGQNRMVKKYPLLRGKGKNRSVHPDAFVISLDTLSTFPAGTVVTVQSLIEKNIVPVLASRYGVKVLGTGEMKVAITAHLRTTASARAQIEKAGGTVETL